MMPILEYPPRLQGTEAEQLSDLRDYLVRLVQQLNEAILNDPSDKEVRQ